MENTSVKGISNVSNIKGNILALSAMLLLSPLNLFYVFLNSSERGVRSLSTPVDEAIPFMKVFIIPYVAWYGFIFFIMLYLCFKDRETYYKTLIAYMLGLTTSFITFYFFQTTVPRPELAGSDILTSLVLKIYGADQPYNCFPSIHVLTSYLMARALSTSRVRNKANLTAVWSFSVLIIISTLFIKQHVILDAVSGIIYAEILFSVVNAYGGIIWNIVKKHFALAVAKKKLEA